VLSSPESDFLPYGWEWEGVRGIQRHAWKEVPGYAERICKYLSGILSDKDVPLN
jgi:hypothetical protein